LAVIADFHLHGSDWKGLEKSTYARASDESQKVFFRDYI